MLTSNSKFILNHVFATEGTITTVRGEKLDQLLRFFDTKGELNIVLAGYVAEFLGKLMEVYYCEVSKYLFDNPARIEAIVSHLNDLSISKGVVFPLVFKGSKGIELDTSVLEKKLERENVENALRPLRMKLLKDIWQRCVHKDDAEYVNNVMAMFKEAVNVSSKEEKYKAFLFETLYSKFVVNGLFEYMLSTEVD